MAPLGRQGARRLRAVAATGTIVALGLAGVTAMGDAGSALTAVPGATTTAPVATPQSGHRSERPNRDAARPSLGTTPAASATTKATAHSTTKAGRALTPAPSRPATTRSSASAPTAIGTRYTTVALNLRTGPHDDARLVTVLPAGSKVTITTATSGSYRGVLYQGKHRWVHGRYLATSKPSPATKASSSGSSSVGVSVAACSSGSSVERGLTPDAVRVHRAVCHAFPQITSYGGVRADGFGEHGSGRAVDCMLPHGAGDNALGWRVAKWVRAHAKELGVSQVIFDQHIWTVQRSFEGWRSMPDRGGVTANHRDHVHVTVYGSSGTS